MITVRLGRPPKVDPAFWELSFPERLAVIAHEAGHVYHGHLWRRMLCTWFMNREQLSRYFHHQEYEADQFARALGLGSQLASFLRRRTDPSTLHHPATRDRVAHLVR